jgi:hypothetical protein
MKKLIILFITLFFFGSLSAQKNTASSVTKESTSAGFEPGYINVKKCDDFTITGDGSSDTWKRTEWITLVHQGSDFISYETKAKVLYSGTGIYFLFYCQDEKLTTTMQADNLNLWEEDVVEVLLKELLAL